MTKNFEEFVARRRRRPDDDSKYMEMAVKIAEVARANGDIAHAAVLVFPDGSHFYEHDTSLSEFDPTCHAEMNVIRKASRLKPRGLKDCVLYTTVEPCPMCAHAALMNGVREVVFGAYDSKDGFLTSERTLAVADGIAVKGGVLAERCIEVMPKLLQEHLTVEKENG